MNNPELEILPNGSKYWHLNGKLHREDGSAIEYVNGDKCWFLNGKLHRVDGPAIEYGDGDKYWYLNGKKYSEQEWKNEIFKLNLKKQKNMKQVIINIPDGYTYSENKSENGVIIDFIKTDNEKEMKEFFKQFLTGLELVTTEKYPNSVFYKKDGKVIFELYQDPKNPENKDFYVDYYTIWEVLITQFGLNRTEIQSFIKKQVESTLKLGQITPHACFRCR